MPVVVTAMTTHLLDPKISLRVIPVRQIECQEGAASPDQAPSAVFKLPPADRHVEVYMAPAIMDCFGWSAASIDDVSIQRSSPCSQSSPRPPLPST